MPGIVGLVTKMPREWAEPQLLRMVESLRHESFYQTGTWVDESLGIYVGWTALKNSFSDGMPLSNERGDVVLVFSGEEYPEPGTAARLKERGHACKAEGSSYLVHLCEEDPTFPAGLNGRFHGLLTDRTRGTTVLFNDRYGMHRICYHESKEAFYFAAEAKAILAVRPELRRADPRGLAEFVACSCTLENRTVFEGIHLLPSAAAWRFRNGSIEEKSTYFEPREWEQQTPFEPEVYAQELRSVLSRNLPRYFNSQVPMGISLTGGLDTRVIMALRKSPPGSLPCYTFGGMFRDSQDVQVARRVASQQQQSYQVITVGDEFLKHFPHYVERSVYLTEGGVDASRSPDLYVSEKARQIAPVKIVGTYGSEIIRQGVMFKPVVPAPGLYRPEFLAYVQQAGDTYAALRREHPVTFAAFRQSPRYHYGILALEQSQLTVRSPYLDNDFVRTVYRAPKSDNANSDIRLRLISEGDPALGRIRTDLGFAGSGGLSAMLSQQVLKFTFKAEYAYDYGMPQWVARIDHLFSPLRLERLFLGRHKFYHFRVWYRDALSKYVREILLDPRTLSRPYIQPNVLETMVRGHLKGDRNYTLAIHKALTLELLHRRFLDSK
jgi:asparagine synthase (glutamine-hydrolysing)